MTRWRELILLAVSLGHWPCAANAADPHPGGLAAGRADRAVVQRVVALAPSLAEMVFAVGAGDRLVGVIEGSDFPIAARQVARVGDYQRLDVERIVLLKPQLVLAWRSGNTSRELAQLEAAGLALVYVEPQRLDDVPRAIERVGMLLGRAQEGRARAASLQAELHQLRQAHAGLARVSVFYQVWKRPLMTLGGRHLVSDVLALCGGRNVFDELDPLVPQVSDESVIRVMPEVILSAHAAWDTSKAWARATANPTYAQWAPYRAMPAVRYGWLYTVSGDLISRQGPRIAQGVRAVCELLQEVRHERAGR